MINGIQGPSYFEDGIIKGNNTFFSVAAILVKNSPDFEGHPPPFN